MTSSSMFSIATLSVAARRHIRVFQLHQLLDRFAMGLTVAVVALALTDRGMDLLQISFLFGVYSLTTMLMELPFGGLADNIGRKPVFQAAVVASMISLVLFLSTSDFYVLALSFAFIGFGRALRSGTLDAWFLEGFKAAAPNVDVQPALARGQWAGAIGLAVGAVLGGLLPDFWGAEAEKLGRSIYDASYAVSLVVMFGVFTFTQLWIVEEPRPLTVKALTQGAGATPGVVKEAGRLALRHPVLPMLFAALALFLIATNPVEVFWPTYARQMLKEGYANTIIGALTATYFFAIALGASLSTYISRFFRRQYALTLVAVFACLAVVQIALALQHSIVGFAAVFIIYSVILGASETPASSILHMHVDDRQRSTMLSLRSLVQQLGAALGLILTGALAEVYSVSMAWMVGAVFLVMSGGMVGVIARRPA